MNKDFIDSLSNLLNVNRDLAFFLVLLFGIVLIIYGKKIIAWLSKKDYVNNQSPLTNSPQNFGGQQAVSSQGAMLAKEQTITNNHFHNTMNLDDLKTHITSEFEKRDQTKLSEGEKAQYEKKINNLEQALKDKQELDQSIMADLTSAKAALPALQIEEAMKKLNAGDRTEAVEILTKLSKAGKELAANAEFQLGKIAYDDIRWAEALVHFERAYALENENEEYIFWVGRLNELLGQYEKALPHYKNLVMLSQKQYPNNDHPYLAIRYNDLGCLYSSLGEYYEGDACLSEAIKIYENTSTNFDKSNLASSYNSKGSLYTTLYNNEQNINFLIDAKILLKKAIKIWENNYTMPKNLDLGAGYNNLAQLYILLDKYDCSETLFKKAIKVCKAVYPNHDHPYLAKSYNNLAGLYEKLGKNDLAEKFYEKAIAIGEKVYPNHDHPDLATSYNNLAMFYKKLGKNDLAEKFYEKAIAIGEKVYPNHDHPDLATRYNNLAWLYEKLGKNDLAEKFYKKATIILIKTLPKTHPDLIRVIENYAKFLKNQGRNAEAMILLKEHRL